MAEYNNNNNNNNKSQIDKSSMHKKFSLRRDDISDAYDACILHVPPLEKMEKIDS